MKNQIAGLIAIVGVLALIAWEATYRRNKIGYVETAVLLRDFVEAERAHAEFSNAQKEWDKNLKSLNDSLVSGLERMKKTYDAASKAQKDTMRLEMQKKNEDLQRYTNAVRKMSEEKEKALMDPVVKRLNSFLDVWGKEHGFDLILGTMSGGNIIQADPSLNLTSKVLVAMNEQYKNPGPSANAIETASTSAPVHAQPGPKSHTVTALDSTQDKKN